MCGNNKQYNKNTMEHQVLLLKKLYMYLQDPWLQKLRQIDRKYKNMKNIGMEKKSTRRHESTSTMKKKE